MSNKKAAISAVQEEFNKLLDKSGFDAPSHVKEGVLEQALQNLIKNGLVEEEIIDGEPCYRLTSIGMKIMDSKESDPSKRN